MCSKSSTGGPGYILRGYTLQNGLYVCKACGRSYKHSVSWYRHKRLECGGKEAQFLCTVCPYKSKRKESLKLHMAVKHNFVIPWLHLFVLCPKSSSLLENITHNEEKYCAYYVPIGTYAHFSQGLNINIFWNVKVHLFDLIASTQLPEHVRKNSQVLRRSYLFAGNYNCCWLVKCPVPDLLIVRLCTCLGRHILRGRRARTGEKEKNWESDEIDIFLKFWKIENYLFFKALFRSAPIRPYNLKTSTQFLGG